MFFHMLAVGILAARFLGVLAMGQRMARIRLARGMTLGGFEAIMRVVVI